MQNEVDLILTTTWYLTVFVVEDGLKKKYG